MSFLGDFYLGGLHWKLPFTSWIPSLNIIIIIIIIINEWGSYLPPSLLYPVMIFHLRYVLFLELTVMSYNQSYWRVYFNNYVKEL